MRIILAAFMVIIFCFSTFTQEKREGGVDVGNFKPVFIPNSQFGVALPISWKVSSMSQGPLTMSSKNKTLITANLETFNGRVSNYEELFNYLNREVGNKKFFRTNINGLKALKYISSDSLTQETYVISESKEIASLKANIKKSDLYTADLILNTIFFKYEGVPLLNQIDHTVILDSKYRFFSFSTGKRFLRKEPLYSSMGVLSRLRGELEIGLFGIDSGKIVDLELSNSGDYEKISIDEHYLRLPKTNVEINKIYQTLNKKRAIENISSAKLKKNTVYLIRTVRWPDEDLLLKMKVVSIDENNNATLRFKKLAEIPPRILSSYVESMNRYTLEVESKKTEGIVKLYDRTLWAGAYIYSNFNFFYATRDNQFITRNHWDLMFVGGSASWRSRFIFPVKQKEGSGIVDIGKRSLDTLTLSDFNKLKIIKDKRLIPTLGHTYLIINHSYKYSVWSAVSVIDIEPKKRRWLKLQWKNFKKVMH